MGAAVFNTDPTVLLEHYRALREQVTFQCDRLWKRFHLLLTLHVALGGAFLASQNVQQAGQLAGRLPVLGFALSVLWFIIGAQDLWYYDDARKRLDAFGERWIFSQIPGWTNEKVIPRWSWKRPFRFQIPHVGVTTFVSIVPLLCALLWGLVEISR